MCFPICHVGKKGPHRTEHYGVHYQFAGSRGTGDQRAGASGAATVVDVTTVSRSCHEGFQLAVETIEQGSVGYVIDDGVTVLPNVLGDSRGRRARRKMMETHPPDTRKGA